jgi:hypothetical protein
MRQNASSPAPSGAVISKSAFGDAVQGQHLQLGRHQAHRLH